MALSLNSPFLIFLLECKAITLSTSSHCFTRYTGGLENSLFEK